MVSGVMSISHKNCTSSTKHKTIMITFELYTYRKSGMFDPQIKPSPK